MKEIKNEKELSEALNSEDLLPCEPDSEYEEITNTEQYKYLGYKCACGRVHAMEGPVVVSAGIYGDYSATKMMYAKKNKFFYSCDKGIITLIEIKGILKKKCVPIWFCAQNLFDDFGMKIIKTHKSYKYLKKYWVEDKIAIDPKRKKKELDLIVESVQNFEKKIQGLTDAEADEFKKKHDQEFKKKLEKIKNDN